MVQQTGVYWPVGAGTVVRLEGITASGVTVPYACSADGSVIVGYAVDAGGANKAARWDSGALTLLEPISGADQAIYCSDDGTIIIGGSTLDAYKLCYWTSGGTVGHSLAPLSGDTGVASQRALTTGSSARVCSADGSKIIGVSYPSATGVLYTSGTPSSIGSGNVITSISSDGSLITGTQPSGTPTGGFWNGTWYNLQEQAFTSGNSDIYGCTADGSTIFGTIADFGFPPAYWDLLSSASTDLAWGTVYGHIHAFDRAASNDTLRGWAEDSNVVIGAYVSGGAFVPEKWVAGVRSDLPLGSGWGGALPTGICGDGHIIAANTNVGVSLGTAGYWSTSGFTDTAHTLPDLTPSLLIGSQVYGISRDGSVIFGISFEDTASPPSPPSCTALYSLDTIPPWPP
jgi:uncharacterized membrane protein